VEALARAGLPHEDLRGVGVLALGLERIVAERVAVAVVLLRRIRVRHRRHRRDTDHRQEPHENLRLHHRFFANRETRAREEDWIRCPAAEEIEDGSAAFGTATYRRRAARAA